MKTIPPTTPNNKYNVVTHDNNSTVMTENQLKQHLARLSFNQVSKTKISFVTTNGELAELTGSEAYTQLKVSEMKSPRPSTKK